MSETAAYLSCQMFYGCCIGFAIQNGILRHSRLAKMVNAEIKSAEIVYGIVFLFVPLHS